jgi:hypothetical protein
MKTYKQFMTEALPALLAAPAVAKAAGAAMAGVGAAGLLMKSRRQGSQPADYGQERSTTSRGKSTQRPSGKMGAADRQKRQAAADRRAAAKERAQERSSSSQVSEPKPTTKPKPSGQKVDPRLERAAGQVLDRIRKGQ